MADDRTLAERLLAGDKRALARAISLVEDDDPEGWELVREVYPHTGKAPVIGFTGPPGAGKSTLIGALVKRRRAADREVAVLSIDPSSPFRSGALLGDRIRLTEHFLDPGVFIRSMANRGALGGLAEAALQAALLMDAAGKDDVLPRDGRRRPGRGRRHRPRGHRRARAHPRLGRLDPGAQGRRDGDPGRHRRQQGRPPADRHDGPRDPRRALARARRAAGACRSSRPRPTRGEGVEELAAKLDDAPRVSWRPRACSPSAAAATSSTRCSGWRRRACAAELEASLREDPDVQALLDEVVARRLDPASAAAEVLARRARS